jgi:UDP-N-acetylmuramyl pentapeptide synthase
MLMCPVKLISNWKKYDVYLVEMGIDSPNPPKNMSYLLSILKPSIGVFLNATAMHSEPFDYLVSTKDPQERIRAIIKLIANEKGKLVTSLKQHQTAILNIDQVELANLIPQIQAQLQSFGKSEKANIKIIDYQISTNGLVLLIKFMIKK